MRVPEDLRRTVMFLGFPTDEKGKGGINCVGTAFLCKYDKELYLVTAKHVARGIGDNPFLLRINRADGGSDNIDIDDLMGRGPKIVWHTHPDPNVDVAVSLFPYDLGGMGFDCRGVDEHMIASELKLRDEFVGIGDMVYTVGLFRFLAGVTRNVPVVHSGNIALLPSDELVPVDDWDMPKQGRTKRVEAYLVQSQSLNGLSGSPVFVRSSVIFDGVDMPVPDNRHLRVRLPRHDLFLLGVWQGAWDAKADDVLAAGRGSETRVPVGFGVVTPTEKLIEVLDLAPLKAQRNEREQARQEDKE